jgi:hypothetical protein
MTFLSKLLNIGSLELEFIEEHFEFFTQGDKDNIFDYVRGYLHINQIDTNIIIEAIFNRINELVFTAIKVQIEGLDGNEEVVKICQSRIDEFSPYLNCVDSSFNNELDKVDVRGRTFTEIVGDVHELVEKGISK